MSRIYTYARVSSTDQNLDAQKELLTHAYPQAVCFEEKQSGTSLKNRSELETILKVIAKSDKLVVWKLDRLARNMADLSRIVELLESKSASLEILDQKIDTSTASGKAFLQMLGVFAEFETNLRKERQMAGVVRAKAQGKYRGKQANKAKHKHVRELLDQGYKVTDIAKLVGMSQSMIYNLRKNNIV